MQIRHQLRALALTFDPVPMHPWPQGASGKYARIRFKSAKSHPGRGSKVGQSKQGTK